MRLGIGQKLRELLGTRCSRRRQRHPGLGSPGDDSLLTHLLGGRDHLAGAADAHAERQRETNDELGGTNCRARVDAPPIEPLAKLGRDVAVFVALHDRTPALTHGVQHEVQPRCTREHQRLGRASGSRVDHHGDETAQGRHERPSEGH
ncbi:MAG: hypothetical protein QG626_457 [Patescibacteria group bacterium]|nr:hypothetical protein [Patescibacteria group bacterium]